jgi:hypothetical protein
MWGLAIGAIGLAKRQFDQRVLPRFGAYRDAEVNEWFKQLYLKQSFNILATRDPLELVVGLLDQIDPEAVLDPVPDNPLMTAVGPDRFNRCFVASSGIKPQFRLCDCAEVTSSGIPIVGPHHN